MLDIVIKNGTLIDGTGAPGIRTDVGIRDGKVALVGGIESESVTRIDAAGKVVTPGFIDLHTHSDSSFLIDPLADSKLTQGVTLEFFGNCGMSYCAPLVGAARDQFTERMSRVDGSMEPTWTGFDGYLDALEAAGSTINVATQVGHGTVRAAVMGMDARHPTPDEMDRMVALTAESLEAGALGVSTGLWYAPGSYSLTEEVVKFTEPAAERGLLYSSHIRSESIDACGLFPAHAETIEIGRRTGARIQLSHVKAVGPWCWGDGPLLLEGMERARKEGIDIAGDQYPYAWSSTGFAGAMFPRWALAGGRKATIQMISDSDMRERVKKETAVFIARNHGPEGSVVAHYPPDKTLEGRDLEDISREWKCEPEEAALRLYEESDGSYVLHSMEDADVYAIAADPYVAVASDGSSLRDQGPLASGKPHPRSYATNSQFIQHMVLEKRLMTLEEAIRKMTSLPAERLDLKNRGRIAPGMFADVLVFDPSNVKVHATFAQPHQYSTGFDWVIVNGKPAVAKGRPNGSTHGKVLRKKTD